jgi:tyrosyl-tRNA synthetase
MDLDERFELIKRNTEEIVTEKELKKLLNEKEKPVVYLGTAITGKPHVGYYVWVLKLSDFLKAGFKVKLLLADLHGALDNSQWSTLEKRYDYYARILPLMFKSIGVNVKDLEIVKGSEFQLKPEYSYDILRVSTIVSVNDCKRAASEVVKFGENPNLSGLIYPIMQSLDEVYLDADVQYAGVDQRKIMMFARENLPKIKYDKRIEVMTPLIPGLMGKKMSASDEKSKIDLLDSKEDVKNKVKNAEFIQGKIDNGIMAFLKNVLMTIKKDKGGKIVIKRDKKYGGDLEYEDYEDIEKDVKNKKIHPLDLKLAVAEEINKLLEVVRKDKKVWELGKRAYQ